MKYEIVIGLEVHVELLTRSKLFCGCPNDFSAKPNTNVCEICLGFPGTLPHLNGGAVDQALRAALALNCEISLCSRFDRKNYFYPDTPKGYQTTQFFKPIGEHGHLEIEGPEMGRKVVGITRVHIEEDAGKLVHSPAGDCSMVDFNRAGVPLVEIVSEPDLRSPAEARCYLERLKSILQYARVSDCKMEEGSLRCDANISLRPPGQEKLGIKTELKNMNSFRAVERALEYEIRRQAEILDGGGEVISETRRWIEEDEETVAMRSKLESYRYFTDPELAPVELSAAYVEETRSSLPEFAPQRIVRYIEEYELPRYDAEVITGNYFLSEYFESCLQEYPHPKTVSNWLMGDFTALVKTEGKEIEDLEFSPSHLVDLLDMIDEGLISGKIAKQVLETSFKTGQKPRKVVETEGLLQITDEGKIEEIVNSVVSQNPSSVNDYRGGKKKALGFLVGQVMKITAGKANPQLVNKLLRKILDES